MFKVDGWKFVGQGASIPVNHVNPLAVDYTSKIEDGCRIHLRNNERIHTTLSVEKVNARWIASMRLIHSQDEKERVEAWLMSQGEK